MVHERELTIGAALMFYSEWLDGQGLTTAVGDDDKRTHENLVEEFLTGWRDRYPRSAYMPGDAPTEGTIEHAPWKQDPSAVGMIAGQTLDQSTAAQSAISTLTELLGSGNEAIRIRAAEMILAYRDITGGTAQEIP